MAATVTVTNVVGQTEIHEFDNREDADRYADEIFDIDNGISTVQVRFHNN